MRILIIGNVVFIFLLFVGCQQRMDTEVKCKYEIKIDPEQAQDSILFSDLFERISYIRIPTDDDFLIGRIDKLIVSDRHIFMLDRKLSRSVFCIDKSGNKVFEIHRPGKGPGEYIDLRDIAFDSLKQEILLFCAASRKIIRFDLSGKFLREKKIPVWAVGIHPVDKGMVVYCDYNMNKDWKNRGYYPNLVLLDSMMNVIDCHAYFQGNVDKSFVWSSRPDFCSIDNKAGVMPDHTNVIYHVSTEHITPVWSIDFGKYNIDDRYWKHAAGKNMSLKKWIEYCRVEGVCECVYYMENEGIIYFMYSHKGEYYHVFYFKENGRLLHSKKVVNDFNRFGGLKIQTLHKGNFYGNVGAGIIYENRDRLKEFVSEDILENLEMSDNPIIINYVIKK